VSIASRAVGCTAGTTNLCAGAARATARTIRRAAVALIGAALLFLAKLFVEIAQRGIESAIDLRAAFSRSLRRRPRFGTAVATPARALRSNLASGAGGCGTARGRAGGCRAA